MFSSLFKSKSNKMDHPPKDDLILELNGLLKKHNAILSGDRLLQLYSTEKEKEGWINEMNIIVQVDQAKNLINEICNEKNFILTSVLLPCRKYSDTDVMYFTIQKKKINLIYAWNGSYVDELGVSSDDWIIPALPEIPAGQQLDFIKVDNNDDWIIVKYDNKEYAVPKNYTDFINIFIHVTMHIKVKKVISTYPFSFTQIWYDGVNTYSNYKQDIEKGEGSLIKSESKRCDENYINNKLIYYSSFFKINNNQINNTQNISLPELPEYLRENYDFFDSFFDKIIDIFEPSLLLENIELFKLYKVYEYINIKICHFDNIIKFIKKYSNLSTIQKVVLEFAINSYKNIFSPYDWSNIRDFFNQYYDKLLNTLYLIAYLEVEEKTTYEIYLTADFVLKTQYRPRNIEDFVGEYEPYQKLINDKSIRVIYSCPKGHLHDAIGCGIPVNISTCGTLDNDGKQCECLIGGLKHMLVPGNYIVYHAGSPTAQNANINYGWFPIESYKTYESILNQANDAIDNYNENSNEIKKLEKITRQYDKPILQTARLFDKDSDSFDITPDSECPICSDKLDYENDETLYILPCNHLIHKDCLLLARGGDLNNLDDVDGIRKCGACNQHFNFGLRLRSSHASKRVRRRSIRRSRIQNKARSGRRSAPRLTKSHKKRSIYGSAVSFDAELRSGANFVCSRRHVSAKRHRSKKKNFNFGTTQVGDRPIIKPSKKIVPDAKTKIVSETPTTLPPRAPPVPPRPRQRDPSVVGVGDDVRKAELRDCYTTKKMWEIIMQDAKDQKIIENKKGKPTFIKQPFKFERRNQKEHEIHIHEC